jgi:hypothetical protein
VTQSYKTEYIKEYEEFMSRGVIFYERIGA